MSRIDAEEQWANRPAARPDETGEDGRHLRRDRNRATVVEALLELYAEGNLQPSSEEIALRAGLSPRSLFRYFDDIDDLARTAILAGQQRVLPLTVIDVRPGAHISERVAAVVKQRIRLFEAVAPAATVSRLRAPFMPVIADQVTQARAYLRHQLKLVFAPELEAAGPAVGAGLLAAADVLCSFESYQLLRQDQRLGRARLATTLNEALMRLWAPPPP